METEKKALVFNPEERAERSKKNPQQEQEAKLKEVKT
jgi:hypothetical protein